jgi:phage tail-like protein
MAVPLFTVNAHRFDPYRNFKFRVKWDGKYVAPSTSRKLPGKTSYEGITLEAGVTHDTTFEEWANKVNNFADGDPGMSLKEFRKDIIIDVFNLQGSKVLAYKVYRCWVSEFQALPELDASGNAVMIQTIKLENEGWERDTSVTEPTET